VTVRNRAAPDPWNASYEEIAVPQSVPEEQRQDIEGLYAAFNQQDIDAVLERVAPDVVWANGMEGGHVLGADALRAYWARQFDPLRSTVEPKEMTVEAGGRVRIVVHQIVRSLDGRVLTDGEVIHLVRFDGGAITRFDTDDR
jgi:ketosteroid isomerase-like protein